MTSKILVVEANPREANARILSSGEPIYSEIYRGVIGRLAPTAETEVLFPDDELKRTLDRLELGALDGVVWTGSSLNAYLPSAEISTQLDLFTLFYEARVPIFGSCWGLQLMATALGGRVRKNPWGREIGVARRIKLTRDGASHVMYEGKPSIFDAPCTHTDDVEILPKGSQILAENDAGIQAAVLDDDGRSFWGVQYHPEFSLRDLAAIFERRAGDLLAEGFFSGPAEMQAACFSFREIDLKPSKFLQRRSIYGISDCVALAHLRELEIGNWIRSRVLPMGRQE